MKIALRDASYLADPDLAFIPLESWTVYGDLVPAAAPGPASIDICDIGVLPPPGCYLGILSGEGGPHRARLTVGPRRTGDPDGYRRVAYEVIGPGSLSQRTPVSVTFEAVEASFGKGSGLALGKFPGLEKEHQ